MLPKMPGHGLPLQEKEEIEQMWVVEYDEKRKWDLLNGTTHSTEYYRDNREKMDKGAEASWPERFSESKGEISAIQSAMNLYLTDEISFFCEAQNAPMPLESSDRPPLTIEDLEKVGIDIPKDVIPSGSDYLTAFIDVSRNVLWYTVMAWNKETFKGHVVNYGVWPDQRKPYVTLANVKKTIGDALPGQEYSVALASALDTLVGNLMSIDYRTEGGHVVNIERIGVDSGWGEESQTVYDFCRRSQFKAILTATKGFGSTPLKRPLVDPEKKREPRSNLVGQWKFTRNIVGNNLLSYDTNLWKSKVNTQFRLPATSASGFTIFDAKTGGRKPNHRMFHEQIIAEDAMTVEGGGRRIETWKCKPGKDNHFLDCVVGCSVLSNVLGGKMQFTAATLASVGGNKSKKVRRKRKRFTKGD